MSTIDPIFIWDRMCPLKEYKVHDRGVKIDHVFHMATRASLEDFRTGTAVEVRYLPGVPGRKFFGVGGRYKGEVVPNVTLGSDDREAMAESNAQMQRTTRGLLKESGQVLEAEGMPGEDDALTTPDEAVRPAAPAPRRWEMAPVGEEETDEERALVWHDPAPESTKFDDEEEAA